MEVGLSVEETFRQQAAQHGHEIERLQRGGRIELRCVRCGRSAVLAGRPGRVRIVSHRLGDDCATY